MPFSVKSCLKFLTSTVLVLRNEYSILHMLLLLHVNSVCVLYVCLRVSKRNGDFVQSRVYLCNSAEQIREQSMTYFQGSMEPMFLFHALETMTPALYNHFTKLRVHQKFEPWRFVNSPLLQIASGAAIRLNSLCAVNLPAHTEPRV